MKKIQKLSSRLNEMAFDSQDELLYSNYTVEQISSKIYNYVLGDLKKYTDSLKDKEKYKSNNITTKSPIVFTSIGDDLSHMFLSLNELYVDYTLSKIEALGEVTNDSSEEEITLWLIGQVRNDSGEAKQKIETSLNIWGIGKLLNSNFKEIQQANFHTCLRTVERIDVDYPVNYFILRKTNIGNELLAYSLIIFTMEYYYLFLKKDDIFGLIKNSLLKHSAFYAALTPSYIIAFCKPEKVNKIIDGKNVYTQGKVVNTIAKIAKIVDKEYDSNKIIIDDYTQTDLSKIIQLDPEVQKYLESDKTKEFLSDSYNSVLDKLTKTDLKRALIGKKVEKAKEGLKSILNENPEWVAGQFIAVKGDTESIYSEDALKNVRIYLVTAVTNYSTLSDLKPSQLKKYYNTFYKYHNSNLEALPDEGIAEITALTGESLKTGKNVTMYTAIDVNVLKDCKEFINYVDNRKLYNKEDHMSWNTLQKQANDIIVSNKDSDAVQFIVYNRKYTKEVLKEWVKAVPPVVKLKGEDSAIQLPSDELKQNDTDNYGKTSGIYKTSATLGVIATSGEDTAEEIANKKAAEFSPSDTNYGVSSVYADRRVTKTTHKETIAKIIKEGIKSMWVGKYHHDLITSVNISIAHDTKFDYAKKSIKSDSDISLRNTTVHKSLAEQWKFDPIIWNGGKGIKLPITAGSLKNDLYANFSILETKSGEFYYTENFKNITDIKVIPENLFKAIFGLDKTYEELPLEKPTIDLFEEYKPFPISYKHQILPDTPAVILESATLYGMVGNYIGYNIGRKSDITAFTSLFTFPKKAPIDAKAYQVIALFPASKLTSEYIKSYKEAALTFYESVEGVPTIDDKKAVLQIPEVDLEDLYKANNPDLPKTESLDLNNLIPRFKK